MIDRSKIALIKVAKKQLGLIDQEYRSIMLDSAGVSSSTELSEDGFRAFMAALERCGFESTANRERRLELQRQGTHATYQQKRKIRAMWDKWKGRDDLGGLNRWLDRHFHVSDIRFLSREQASKVIAALANFKKSAFRDTPEQPCS